MPYRLAGGVGCAYAAEEVLTDELKNARDRPAHG